MAAFSRKNRRIPQGLISHATTACSARLGALVARNCLRIIITAFVQTFRNKYRLRDVLPSTADCATSPEQVVLASDGVGGRLSRNQCFE
jgi:hypothetical protein